MALKYGNESQYTVGAPDCGGFRNQHTWQYFLLYYMPIMSAFSAFVNGWVVWLLVSGYEGRKLLQQSQHVYVLGSAITNFCVATGSNFSLWIAFFVLPCFDLGIWPCFVINIVNYAGGYQILFNVGLICYDRWRLVRLGTAYNHAHEVVRAKWLLCSTSAFSVLAFLVPEIFVAVVTGLWTTLDDRDASEVRCAAVQWQTVPQLNDSNPGVIICMAMIVVQWVTIVSFTTLTSWTLYTNMKRSQQALNTTHAGAATANKPQNSAVVAQNHVSLATQAFSTITTTVGRAHVTTAAASVANKQTANSYKLLRATLVMFGMVLSSLVTFGPLAIVLALGLVAPNVVSEWYQSEILLCLQFSSPALDPFVFALTLPKLRAVARKSTVWRMLTSVRRMYGRHVQFNGGSSVGGSMRMGMSGKQNTISKFQIDAGRSIHNNKVSPSLN